MRGYGLHLLKLAGDHAHQRHFLQFILTDIVQHAETGHLAAVFLTDALQFTAAHTAKFHSQIAIQTADVPDLTQRTDTVQIAHARILDRQIPL